MTNYHVIAKSQELEVLLADGTREKAELVGSDQWTDLAVIRIANTNVSTVAEFAILMMLKLDKPRLRLVLLLEVNSQQV